MKWVSKGGGHPYYSDTSPPEVSACSLCSIWWPSAVKCHGFVSHYLTNFYYCWGFLRNKSNNKLLIAKKNLCLPIMPLYFPKMPFNLPKMTFNLPKMTFNLPKMTFYFPKMPLLLPKNLFRHLKMFTQLCRSRWLQRQPGCHRDVRWQLSGERQRPSLRRRNTWSP